MKVLVLGAGVIGVTTAFYLRRRGAEVTVIDRQPGPGLETTFANGGHLSFGQALPWATPEAPLQLLKWAGRRSAPLRLRARWDPALWRWGARFLRNCTPGRFRANSEILMGLAAASQTCLDELVAEHPELRFGYHQGGVLTVFRTGRAFEREAKRNATGGAPQQAVLDAAACAATEPALASAHHSGKIVGGLLAAAAATGDARQFTDQLAGVCNAMGVKFQFGVGVSGLARKNGAVTGVETSAGVLAADAVVLALASHSPVIARTVGLALPIAPVKGYSVTIPMSGGNSQSPKLGVLDAERKVVVAPVDGGLRAAGTAEFSGYDDTIDAVSARAIADVAVDLFPGLGAGHGPSPDLKPWAGLRPMTPDGPPLLGPPPPGAGCENLFLNTGHGPLGWTLACGSAKIVADWIGGAPPSQEAAMATALERFV